ncbi:MAG: NrfD/PsrC family molybdoenzyme membrane anchor subunit [Lutibacter sp.]|uniref:NrfD/PsrC family molybdoenzyme membrane anchor subunit n=1 Tax=Lutibacter sp. TaxID=1925666 RepID=UPI00299F299E|nr:NrfD/PsrC family molybdoenzyme membrane anchor subunit [Lutibacter sp.]MDX1829074.1 NrfD/PsrC family molybdoenzyme membrane anchor subunit [Lutibacter sp.]
MNVKTRKRELVKEFSPMLEKTRFTTKIWIGVLLAIILVGLYAFALQVIKGHAVTGMRNNVVWGLYIINFIFFVGVSYSGAFISALLHFYKTPWKTSVSRIVEIITVLSIIVGPVFILLCIGRLDRLYFLFIYPRIQSPITWDIIAIITDLIGCFIYLYLTFIPDFAILRDSKKLNIPIWRKKLYRFLAANYQDTPTQRKKLHKITGTMSKMVIAMAIVAYTVLAWIFSLTLQPGWNSTIFAPYFIVAGLYSGICVIIIAMYLTRKYFNLEKYIIRSHFIWAGAFFLIISLLYGYFTFSDYFAKWFSHKSGDINLLETLFDRYFWEFIFANYLGVILPLVILSIKKLRTIKLITFAAVIGVLGLWLNRYLIVIPTLETPYLPIQDTRPEFIHYTATWVEWSLTFAGIASFLLLFTLIIKFIPVVPISGIIDREREINDAKLKSE